MEFPVIKKSNKPFYPTESICPICNADRTKLGSSFFVLHGGALKKVNEEFFISTDDLVGFLSLSYHPGEDSKVSGATLDIVENSRLGQFDIYFCSIDCMRAFFNKSIDKLEAKLK
jgi:hypothetical protein